MKKEQGNIKILCTAVICFVLCCMGGIADATADAADLFTDGDHSGRISAGILDQISALGRAEVLVSFNVDDIRDAAAAKRRSLGLARDSAEIVAEKSALYAEIEEWLLSWLSSGDVEVLKDYEYFPVLFLRVNQDALATLLGLGDGISISENKALHTCLNESLPLISAPQAYSAGVTPLRASRTKT